MIRLASSADVPQILAIYAPYIENTTHTFDCEVPTLEAFADRFRVISARFPWLVWEEEGHILGYAYGSAPFERAAFSWCAEVSVYLAPQAQRRGIGRRLYSALEQLLLLQGYQVIYAIVTDENLPSILFHEALGYRQVAALPGCGVKFGRLCGIVYLEKRLKTGEIPSIMPESFLSIVNNDRKIVKILDILSLS